MNKNIKRHYEAFQRVDRFFIEHPLNPVNDRATVLVGTIASVITAMQTAVSNQMLGRGEFLGGTDDRRRLAKELRGAVREISGTAGVLDPDQYPGAAEQFAMPLSQSYEALLGTARGFLATVGTIKAAFVERGLPADFDELLAEKVATFEVATTRKHDGRQGQKGGTVALKLETRRGMTAVKELDQIVANRLKRTDPVLLEVWKATKQLEHLPESEEETQTPTETVLAAELADQLAGLADLRRVEAGRRLVEDQHRGVREQRVGEPDPLAVALRQRADELPADVRQPAPLHDVVDPLPVRQGRRHQVPEHVVRVPRHVGPDGPHERLARRRVRVLGVAVRQ